MPTYKIPQASQVARVVFTSTWAFLAKAGTIIFCLSVLLWALMYYPRLPEARAHAVGQEAKAEMLRNWPGVFPGGDITAENVDSQLWDQDRPYAGEVAEKAVAAEQLRYSFAGRFGHAIEPVIRPLGYDWKMGVGLVSAFAAREVFVSTMGIVYSAGDSGDDTTSLEQAMKTDHYADGRPVWTPLVAASLLVWFVLAMQCMSTLAVVRRETGGWKWPLGMLVYMNALAYVVALGVYQVGRIWWA
jgi:ferrous iron transport protein B